MALEEFITSGRSDKMGEAVSMLEHLHGHFPEVGDEKEYAKLLVDMKTKVHVQAAVVYVLYINLVLFP